MLNSKVKVLFVCMGNICRSPTAHGVFERLLAEEGLQHLIEVDSAGTHAYHVGQSPDRRARESAMRRGIDLSGQRARQAVREDFGVFDYILAMDQDNFHGLLKICPPGQEEKIHLLMDYAPEFRTREVPDPYYGGETGFEKVLDMVEAAAVGFLSELKRKHG
ncbi:MAG: low molecular weight phosphotyrosine protein phosphatase [Gammaproteobacteria bacterium]|nr:low molecular weight phosphotyrosine protein phosphatase [Gammaproteobacteria bacterium]